MLLKTVKVEVSFKLVHEYTMDVSIYRDNDLIAKSEEEFIRREMNEFEPYKLTSLILKLLIIRKTTNDQTYF